MIRGVCCLLLAFCVASVLEAAPLRYVELDKEGKLLLAVDEQGNRIPDFSHCGYAGGNKPIPHAPVRVVVEAKKGDATRRIQAALDYVAKLKADENGVRGAVLLLAGQHEVAGALRLGTSGVVLRGQGQHAKGTTLTATGLDRRTLIQVRGVADRQLASAGYTVADKYVPVGSMNLRVDRKGLKVGDRVLVERPSTKSWISALRMDRFPTDNKGSWLDWRPGTLDVRFDRVVTKVTDLSITLDAPLTTALDAEHGSGKVTVYTWPGRITNVGIENLHLASQYEAKNEHDEEHAWVAVGVENAEDIWIRRVKMSHFAGSAVSVYESARAVTIEDCESEKPISEVGGYRRHTFYTNGSGVLFRRCNSTSGRHDFATGYLAPGPNAFVSCKATDAFHFSGPIESWASGVLYDNVTMDGGGLGLTNREIDGHGVGWAAANCVLYQCTAPVVTCRTPPGAQNWAIGCWGQFVGDGNWQAMNQAVKPASLYEAQLAERLGKQVAEQVLATAKISTEPGEIKSIEQLAPELRREHSGSATVAKPLALKNGWLVCGDQLVTGSTLGTVWWRGHTLPAKAVEMGAGVTRFVPGRTGPGYTDDLDQLTNTMLARGEAILAHHHGLWYDRRRDDHQMVRRADGEVWPPFYELPWARSGQGKASDGLSKYDLTKFNPWYFARLKEFADHADRKGLLLVQQMYFQHNVLEAGAHWADFPWRPANCLQETGFPEPPPYVNNKRIFMSEAFYDVEHRVRRQLHRAYIRHCLDVLGKNSNVIFMTGEEYTGPLSFMQFWLDTIAEWEKENNRKVLIGLSCTKDVQDAILKDTIRAPRVSIIDLKYWWYTGNGTYDPKSGPLAPRQQLREWKGSRSRSDESIARMVGEYRAKYPDKAILCSLAPVNGWAVLAAGGSVPNLSKIESVDLRSALPTMKPLARESLTARQQALTDEGRNDLVLSFGEVIRLTPADASATYDVSWIDSKTGAVRIANESVPGGKPLELRPQATGPAVLWLRRNVKR